MSDPQKAGKSEESLVPLARTGDNSAMAELIYAILPMVKAKAAAFAGESLEAEDLTQEGMLGFLSAVYSYKPGGEASFRTYAATCINNRIISAVRAHLGKKNVPLNYGIPFEDDELADSDPGADPQNIVTAQEETARLLGILNFKLSGFEKAVIMQYLAGKSYEQTAQILNSTPKAVDNALQRAKKKLKSADSQ